VNAAVASIRDRLAELRERIASAAERSGRHSNDITLVGVAKTFPAEAVRDAIAAGLGDIGENRVQEAEMKIAAVGRDAARWHLVGHLQSNKAARAVALFDRIHGVDGFELAEALSRRSVAAGKVLAAMVQVNASREPSKHGVAPEALEALLERIRGLPGLALDGLMTIGPLGADASETRRCFARLRELRDAAERRLGVRLTELSMGMSGDFEIAIEEGGTMVRIGTALFGERA
jgi:pyridoxal phosphate enzyme (YggS family)